MVSGRTSPAIRQLKRARTGGAHWTKRPSKQPSGQHIRTRPPTWSSICASRQSQRDGSRKNASKTAAGAAFTRDWKIRGARVFSVGMGFVLPADPLRAVAPDFLFPDRHDLFQAVDRVLRG